MVRWRPPGMGHQLEYGFFVTSGARVMFHVKHRGEGLGRRGIEYKGATASD
jgi:hypothetical protein